MYRSYRFRLQPDAFDWRFRLRELTNMIAKRCNVGLGGIERLSHELKPSSHRTIELACIVMREIAQLGKLPAGFIRHTVSSGLNTHARTTSAFFLSYRLRQWAGLAAFSNAVWLTSR